MENFILNNDVKIPKIGFGTYKNSDSTIIENAIKAGYTLLDTASFYNTESFIKEAIKNTNTNRENLFITSKVWKTDMGYDNTIKAFFKTLENLETNYLDLYLIHWPLPEYNYKNWKTLNIDTWKALEDLYNDGKIRAIGVSNFLPHHLDNILENCTIKPMVNQIEYHIGYTQEFTVNFCKKYNILIQAWSPISRTRLFNENLIIDLSKKYNVSLSQLCLKFILQNDICPLPKTSSFERMLENKDLFSFTISKEDMYKLQTLPQLAWSGEHPDRERIYF